MGMRPLEIQRFLKKKSAHFEKDSVKPVVETQDKVQIYAPSHSLGRGVIRESTDTETGIWYPIL